ncbi:MAG: type II toxin-antitoxin system Phd/YefM family antitoxin [Candidatus Omnitrophica bacterium]|nr:type II toxin-antitoxin system Phd/YefM family antitoxin [Candidatus Omnitrophota bacterium]
MKRIHVSVAEAKQHLADLLGRVAYGHERVTITRRGKPMAILIPLDRGDEQRHLADAKGWLDEDDSFFDTMAQIVAGRLTHPPRSLRKSA